MFSTFVGLGRFISCQRPDHTVHHAFMSTDFLKILFRIFAPLSDIQMLFHHESISNVFPAHFYAFCH